MASNTTLCASNVSTEKISIDGSLQYSMSTHTTSAASSGVPAAATYISTTSPMVLITSGGSTHRVTLPSPTTVPMGYTIQLVEATANGYELSAGDDGVTATTINNVAVTDGSGSYAKELAIAASQLVTAIKTGKNAWTVTPGAAAPDA